MIVFLQNEVTNWTENVVNTREIKGSTDTTWNKEKDFQIEQLLTHWQKRKKKKEIC